MTHDQLIAFEAIVASGTFRGAAERLHKSQSAISHAIALLEAELGIRLLSRESYRPRLTPEGEVFFRETSRVLHQLRALRATATRLAANEETEIRLAVAATLPMGRLLPAVAEIGRRFPATNLRLATEVMGGPYARLAEGRADLALATLDGVHLDEVEARVFAEVTIRPVAAPGLAAGLASGVLSIAALQGHPQIVVAGTGGPRHEQSRDLLPGAQRWTVSDFAAKREVILAGLGWGGLPEHLIAADLAEGRLVPLEVDGFPVRRSVIHAIRKRDVPPGPVASEFWALLTSASPAPPSGAG